MATYERRVVVYSCDYCHSEEPEYKIKGQKSSLPEDWIEIDLLKHGVYSLCSECIDKLHKWLEGVE